MNVLYVGSSDIVGSSFNGYAAHDSLSAENIDSRHFVGNAKSGAPYVQQMFNIPGLRLGMRALSLVEYNMSIHLLLKLQSFALPIHRAFRAADVVHYQIIHDGYFSIYAMPWLARLKPPVWTWHDPWFMTRHCIYPVGLRTMADRVRILSGARSSISIQARSNSLWFSTKEGDLRTIRHRHRRRIEAHAGDGGAISHRRGCASSPSSVWYRLEPLFPSSACHARQTSRSPILNKTGQLGHVGRAMMIDS